MVNLRRYAAMAESNVPNAVSHAASRAARTTDREVAPSGHAQGPTFAALDLGTNNCRLMVGTPAGDGFRVVDSFSRIVRLGEGLHLSGWLSPAAMDRTIAALHGCAARLSRRPPVRALRAIATEACRQATNGADFIARAERETGLHIDIISPREEAELALESCAPLLQGCGRRALLFDIGGGSTELAWVRLPEGREAPHLIGYLSMPVGVVTLAERLGAARFTTEGFHEMMGMVTDLLRPFEAVHCIGQEIRQGGVKLLGTSGTVTTLAGISLNLRRYSRCAVDGVTLTRGAADAALTHLRALGPAGLDEHPCIGPERAGFVLPGCAIYAAIHALWPAPEVLVADRGLREGMLLRLMRGAPQRSSRASQTRSALGRPPRPG
jgi:exopolyphosphatase/guanosine-5'-triphosphate,3'-diphosphate pyrophosphatase